jgi:phosphate starvation-inducible protein PhoH
MKISNLRESTNLTFSQFVDGINTIITHKNFPFSMSKKGKAVIFSTPEKEMLVIQDNGNTVLFGLGTSVSGETYLLDRGEVQTSNTGVKDVLNKFITFSRNQ